MKKLYFIGLALISFFEINAQLIVTKSFNDPISGDTFDMNTLDTTTTLPIAITGTAVTWNVTGVSATGAINTNTFAAPANYPSSSSYPGVTIVRENLVNGDLIYHKSTATTFELLGSTLNLGQAVVDFNYDVNPAILYNYPLTMGSVSNDIGQGSLSSSTISGTFTSTIQTTASGSGTLIFNNFSNFPNCLMVHTKQNTSFSVFSGLLTGNIYLNSYNYYHSSSKHPIFTVNYSHVVSAGFLPLVQPIDNRISTVESISTVVTGLKNNKQNNVIFSAYPNPANNELSINFVLVKNENYTIQILNTLGQVMKRVSMPNLTAGLYNQVINVADLSSGVYSINVKGNSVSGTQKLVIE